MLRSVGSRWADRLLEELFWLEASKVRHVWFYVDELGVEWQAAKRRVTIVHGDKTPTPQM